MERIGRPSDPRWEPVLEDFYASDNATTRSGWAGRDPGEELFSERGATSFRERVEIRLGRVWSGRCARSRRATARALQIFEELILVGEPLK